MTQDAAANLSSHDRCGPSEQKPSEADEVTDRSASELHSDLEELSSLQERLAAKLSAADS